MDFNRDNYWQSLLFILKSISKSQFISISLQLTAVQSNEQNDNTPRPSLQEVYESAKEVAEEFNILQVGWTCISWNDSQNCYLAKTFSAPLAMGVLKDNHYGSQLSNKCNRHFGLSEELCAFLCDNGFDFDTVLHKGVPYLSLQESTSEEVLKFQQDQEEHDYIELRSGTAEMQSFYYALRRDIREWISQQAFE